MSKDKSYIHLFKSVAEYEEARNNNYYEPWVSYTEGVGGGLAYDKTEREMPLTIKALESGVFRLEKNGNFLDVDLHYSKNGGERTTITSADTINVNAGDVLELYGNNACFYLRQAGTSPRNARFFIRFKCNIYGNIMSIFNGDDFKTNSEFTSGYENQCVYLFDNCKIVDASKLILPATMLAFNCYGNMFESCDFLTSAPELPAATLVDYCYYNMFYGCTSLNYIKCLATNISATEALGSWVENVATSGTFVKKAGVSWPSGVGGIPSGWTVQEV